MDELVKSLANRITRDFAYFIGGGTIICSTLLLSFSEFHSLKFDTIPSVAYFLLLGIGYVLGFIVQEVFSLIPGFQRPSIYKNGSAGTHVHWLGCIIFTSERHGKANMSKGFNMVDAACKTSSLKHDDIKQSLDRTITLKHLGTCIGPCWLFSGIALLFHNAYLGISLLVSGVVLIVLGRLKAMQEIAYLQGSSSER